MKVPFWSFRLSQIDDIEAIRSCCGSFRCILHQYLHPKGCNDQNYVQLDNPDVTACSYIKDYVQSSCLCNKVATALLGTSVRGPLTPDRIQNALVKCAVAPPSCTNYGSKTYNGGSCAITDEDLDFMRFVNANRFASALLSFAEQKTCFDIGWFKNIVTSAFNSNAVAYGGQGLGVYEGVDLITEYFSLLSPQVNKGFVAVGTSKDPTVDAMTTVDGRNITIGKWVSNLFADRLIKNVEKDYLETTFTFNGCDAKASQAILPGQSSVNPVYSETGVISLADMLYRTVNADQMEPANQDLPLTGITSICKQHTKACVGSNAQFTSESECLAFYASLPRFSSVCGAAAVLSGNSVTCRAKHQFMAQIAPDMHCKHLGRVSEACIDTKCETQGSAVSPNTFFWPAEMLQALKTYTGRIGSAFRTSGQWRYSNYCSNDWVTPPASVSSVSAGNIDLWGLTKAGLPTLWDGQSWTPNVFKQVITCPHGQIYAVSTANEVFNYFNGVWSLIPGGLLAAVACGNDGTEVNAVYAVSPNGYVYKHNGQIWVLQSGMLKGTPGSITVGGGRVWGLNPSGVPVYKDGSNWVAVSGIAVQITSCPNGQAYVVTSSNQVFIWQNNDWKLVPSGALSSIACGNDGIDDSAFYAVSPNGFLYKYNGSIFVLNSSILSGSPGSVAVGAGQIWGLTTDFVPTLQNPQGWNRFPGTLVQAITCPNSQNYALTSSNEVYRLQNEFWYKVPGGALSSIACGNDGVEANALWAVGPNGIVYKHNGSVWVSQPGALRGAPGSIAVGGGRVSGLNPSGVTVYKDGSNWVSTGGVAVQILACPNGQVYFINSSNSIYIWNNGWNLIPAGALSSAACGNDGSNGNALYAVGPDGTLYKYGSNFDRFGQVLKPTPGSISIGGGQLFGITTDGAPSAYDGKVWSKNPGALIHTAKCTNNQVFALNALNEAYRLQNGVWYQIPGGALSSIACGDDGIDTNAVYSVSPSGSVFKYNGSVWVSQPGALRGAPGSIAVGGGRVWGLTPSGVAVYKNGSNWVSTSGVAVQILACPNGQAYFINSSNSIYSWNNGWNLIPAGALSSAACGNDGVDGNALYAVGPDGTLYKYGSNFDRVGQMLKSTPGSISIGGGQLFGVAPDGAPTFYFGKRWSNSPGVLKQIVTCPNNKVFAINLRNQVLAYQTGQWNVIPNSGPHSAIACGNDGIDANALYGVSPSNFVYKYNGQIWVLQSGMLYNTPGSIAVGLGRVWGINDSGTYSNAAGAGWLPVAGTFVSIAAGDGGVMAADRNDYLYKWNGSSMVQTAGQLRTISVNNIFLYGVNVYGNLFQRTLTSL